MKYQILPATEGEPQIFARIDDDGLCRLTCTTQHQPMLDDLANGAELLDADGNTMSAEQVAEFLQTLP
jgi:hypothetical protein